MPLLSMLRFLFTFLSLLVLGGGVWALWNWYNDEAYVTANWQLNVVAADWRLWAGLVLLVWSFLGKFLWVPILARPDKGLVSDPHYHSAGEEVLSESGAKLYVEEHGSGQGPTLVFVHGWAMDSTIWSYARRHFELTHRVVMQDLSGLGRSKVASDITLDTLSIDLHAVISRIQSPVILIGHSIGGMTIQPLAKRRSELFDGRRVAGVVLLNTTYTNPLRTMILPRLALALRPILELAFRLEIALWPLVWVSSWQSYLSGSTHMSNRIAHGPKVTRSQLEHTALLTTRNNPGVLARGNLAMFRWDGTDTLSSTQAPVLVLGGADDIVTKPSASERIAASAPMSTLRVLEGANHMSIIDDAPTYHREIELFLARLPSAD